MRSINNIPVDKLKISHRAVQWWLISILLMIPFQPRIADIILLWNSKLANVFNKLDELTIIILLPLAAIMLWKRYRREETNILLYGILILPIITLVLTGLISGLLNGNSLFITAHGIFSYIKNFLLIFIYAAFFRDINTFRKIFRLMFIGAVCAGSIAVIHELCAIYMKYINYDISGMVFNNINRIMIIITGDNYQPLNWRMGIYRTPSIMKHYNLLGFYSIFILTIYLSITKRINVFSFSSLFAGVTLSVSRLAYLSFAFLAGLQTLKGRKWFIALLIIILLMLLYVFFISNDITFFDEASIQEHTITGEVMTGGMIPLREYALSKGLELWKDHPLWGVGPGMFGGDVAVKSKSPLYEEYNAFMLLLFTSLDQFWPQVLAEMGIIGTIAFAGLLVSLLLSFLLSRRWAADELTRGLFTGLAVFTVFIFFGTFSNSLNNAPILYPYCAFAGMGLGCEARHETA
jgi:O-antigen ligase